MRKFLFVLTFVLLISPNVSFAVSSGVTLTPVDGGQNISSDTASVGGNGIFTLLTGPIISEGAIGNIKSGTIKLTAPDGFEFDTANPATVTVDSSTSNPSTNINHLASGSIITTNTTSSTVSFVVTSQSTSAKNTLTYDSIWVRPTLVATIPSADIVLSSTNSILNLTLPMSVGILSEIEPVTLSSIAISHPADKLLYTVGEPFDITGLEVIGTYTDSSTMIETITESDVTGFDSSVPTTGQVLTITVNGKTVTYTIDIVAPLSTDKYISSFIFTDLSINGDIDENTHSISVFVPYSTDVTTLIPTINIVGKSMSPESGVAQDFTNPVVYTVTAEDDSTQNYTVNVAVLSDLTALKEAITNAQKVYDDAVEGINPGQYPTGSRDVLQSEINNALSINEFSTPTEISVALNDLINAVSFFESLVIKENPVDEEIPVDDSNSGNNDGGNTHKVYPSGSFINPHGNPNIVNIDDNIKKENNIPLATGINNNRNVDNVVVNNDANNTEEVNNIEDINLGASAGDSVDSLGFWDTIRTFLHWIFGF